MFASAERRIELDEQRRLRTASAVADELGHMKGALIKLGQVASPPSTPIGKVEADWLDRR